MWWLWVIGGIILLAVVCPAITSHVTMPDWARAPCPKCGGGRMKWLKGQDSGSTGEALFFCKDCAHKEHRGGWASEIAMESWEAKQ